jgi:hypothetical protein
MQKLKELLDSLGDDASYLVTISYITEDRTTVKTECIAENFPVNDLTTARSEASRLIYEMQESQNQAQQEAPEVSELEQQVKGLLG